jgi:hypothetical protein
MILGMYLLGDLSWNVDMMRQATLASYVSFVIKLFAFHQNMGLAQHFLAQAHIAKLNELTESEVTKLTRSTLNGTALAILQRQGS